MLLSIICLRHQVQNFNFVHDFKPGSFYAGFQVFTKGQLSFKTLTQILHLGAFAASSWVLVQLRKAHLFNFSGNIG